MLWPGLAELPSPIITKDLEQKARPFLAGCEERKSPNRKSSVNWKVVIGKKFRDISLLKNRRVLKEIKYL